MQDRINKIADWITSNKLSLNTAKTKFILFISSNRKLKHNNNFYKRTTKKTS